jgi:protoporphyrinogen oxidase
MRVVIVGAGFAGLAAARTLKMAAGGRLDLVVLEGSHRVAGRAHTIKVRAAASTSVYFGTMQRILCSASPEVCMHMKPTCQILT